MQAPPVSTTPGGLSQHLNLNSFISSYNQFTRFYYPSGLSQHFNVLIKLMYRHRIKYSQATTDVEVYKLDKFSFMRYLCSLKSISQRCIREYGILVLKSVPIFRELNVDDRKKIMVREHLTYRYRYFELLLELTGQVQAS